MNRKPSSPPPDVQRHKKDEHIHQIRRYKVITPLFGGGVDTQQADPITVVRAPEVRGQLRFWWRATRGGQFSGDLNAMKLAEGNIWGTAAAEGQPGPSMVDTVVTLDNGGTVLSHVEIQTRRGSDRVDLGHPRSDYSYVAFPLRAEPGKPGGSVRTGVEFSLSLRFPKSFSQDIESALWAWETFGGIGARTRRGFGALQCTEIINYSTDGHAQISNIAALPVSKVATSIGDGLKKHVASGRWPKDVPHLLVDHRLSTPNANADVDAVWKHLFKKLKDFRQTRWPDRDGRRYGRSKWPEPDAIRDLTRRSAPTHSTRRLSFNKFPRADFGLPIIFQFKDVDVRAGDPQQTVLQGAEHDRLASRLILRPLACADGKAVGLAAVLHGPAEPPGGLTLQGAPGDPSVSAKLIGSEAKDIPPLKGNTDVLQAFLNWL